MDPKNSASTTVPSLNDLTFRDFAVEPVEYVAGCQMVMSGKVSFRPAPVTIKDASGAVIETGVKAFGNVTLGSVNGVAKQHTFVVTAFADGNIVLSFAIKEWQGKQVALRWSPGCKPLLEKTYDQMKARVEAAGLTKFGGKSQSAVQNFSLA